MAKTDEITTAAIEAIHLDAVGGIAGDMFVAAMLDALPSAWEPCQRAIAAMEPPADVAATISDHNDGVLTGRRFNVSGVAHDHHHDQGHGHDHTHGAHRSWREIRQRLETADLKPTERDIAIDIFARLATAEAAVHGIAPDDVTFHEVGAWDSIIDIVAAAAIIAQLAHCRWSVGALPRGRGLVKSAHGMLPVPAPATVELLKDFTLHDDGEEGERITPTGAAILNYLEPSQSADPVPRKLLGCGTGFGTKRLARRSNILRASLYGAAPAPSAPHPDTIEVLRFEIDDQTAEDLSIALENIRQEPAVLDVCQWPVFAKKGRIATAVQILVQQGAGSAIAQLVFDETTTLGVRRGTMARETIERTHADADGISVKIARRPGGATAKAEASDLSTITTHAARQSARSRAERSALDRNEDDD